MSTDCTTIIGGDFNTDISLSNLNIKAKSLKDFVNCNNLSPAPMLSGRIGPNHTFRTKDMSLKSLIDYILVPEFLCNGFTKLEVRSNFPYNVSDHYPVLLYLDMNLLCNTHNKHHLDRKVLLWSKAD